MGICKFIEKICKTFETVFIIAPPVTGPIGAFIYYDEFIKEVKIK